MDKIVTIIEDYIQWKNHYALQIDGTWGTGKTYFIKNTVTPLCTKYNYHPIYFSVYGYNDLIELKQALINKIVLDINKYPKIVSEISKINKKATEVLSSLHSNMYNYHNLISDCISEYYTQSGLKKASELSLIIFMDDLERLSDKISIKDLLGFISVEILEKLSLKMIIISNSLEMKNHDDFKKMKEKVINRTIKFSSDITTIEKQILMESGNLFIKNERKWITQIIQSFQSNRESLDLNLRTLSFILESYDIIESKLKKEINELNDKNSILMLKKSLFLNIFVITSEYKLGNLTEENLNILKKLTNTRYLGYYLNENESKTIVEKIIDKYHNKNELFDKHIFYSDNINYYILTGYFENNGYVSAWENNFVRITDKNDNLEKLNSFRRLTDEELKNIQEKIIKDVQKDNYGFEELLKVYRNFSQFRNMELVLIQDNYIDIIENKLIQSYSNYNNKNFCQNDEFYLIDIDNFKSDRPELYQKFKKIDEKRKYTDINRFLETLFTKGISSIAKQVQSGFLLNNNIFAAILQGEYIDKYIVTDNNKADLLWQLIRSEYLRYSNVGDLHNEELEHIQLLLKNIESTKSEKKLGRIDNFKIKQLNEALTELIDNLRTE